MTRQKKLVALSMWAHAKVVYGKESDFGGLSKFNVLALAECEICELKLMMRKSRWTSLRKLVLMCGAKHFIAAFDMN